MQNLKLNKETLRLIANEKDLDAVVIGGVDLSPTTKVCETRNMGCNTHTWGAEGIGA